MAVKYKSSVLFVKDIKKATAFYVDYLGLEISEDHEECIGFSCGLSLWEKEYAHNLIGIKNENEAVHNHTTEIYFESDDLEIDYKKYQTLKVDFVHELVEQPWGQKVFRFYDLDKNIIEIGETM